MKLSFLIFIVIFTQLYAFDFTLEISTKNLKNDKGVVQFSLYNKDGTIPDKKQNQYFLKKQVSIHHKSAKAIFKNLPKGRYAVSLYHDENQNNKIDKGIIMPKEGVGLSNYKKINFFNLPDFKKASFLLDSNKSIEVTMNYF